MPGAKDQAEEKKNSATLEPSNTTNLGNQIRDQHLTTGDEAHDKLEYRTNKFLWMFLAYIFLVLYFTNIATNFGGIKLFDEVFLWNEDQGGFWIKILNGFFNSIFYLIFLLSPMICPGRSFGSKQKMARDSKRPTFNVKKELS